MAKTARATETETALSPTATAVEAKIEEFAEDLGRLLGTARVRAENWIAQREQIAKHLQEIRDTANHLYVQLVGAGNSRVRAAGSPRRERTTPSATPSAEPERAQRGPGRPRGSRKRKRTLSPEARERIRQAQLKRWAKVKSKAK